MDEPCTRDELRGCLRDLQRLNRWFRGYRPVLRWLDTVVPRQPGEPIKILDVGCGFGDGLREVEQWAAKRDVPVELTGIDLNPDAIAIAQEATPAESQIHWVASDIFAFRPPKRFDLVMSSLFTHHLSDSDVVRFIDWMEQNAERGWFINDLSRAAVPYHFLRVFTRLMRLHSFVRNDAPVSVARAFVAEDWRRIFAMAGLHPGNFEIQAHQPARLCVARRKLA
jgi:SAM-dependent methyltransferase